MSGVGGLAGSWVGVGGGGGTATKYTTSFNATTSWGTASGGYYSQTILASVHGKGVTPIYQFEGITGSDFEKLFCDQEKVNASGDITFRVAETPDNRFAGRIVVS